MPAMDLDLSSLEGPPINDPRFTIRSPSPRRRYMNTPYLQLENTAALAQFSHNRTTQQIPPRPASADGVLSPSKFQLDFGGYYNPSNCSDDETRKSNRREERRPRQQRPRPRQTTPRETRETNRDRDIPRQQYLPSLSCDTRYQTTCPHSNRTFPPIYQLVWLEQEAMWAMVECTPSSLRPSHSYSNLNHYTSHSGPASPVTTTTTTTVTPRPTTAGGTRPHPHLHSQPTTTTTTTTITTAGQPTIKTSTTPYARPTPTRQPVPPQQRSMASFLFNDSGPEEIPPSYEHHYYDRYLPVRDARRERESRWTEIARRINRVL